MSPDPQDRPEAACHVAQQPVARVVAERVVDDLEVVEVQEHDDRHLGAGRADPLADRFEEQRPVRQPGQRVVVGLVAELLLEARQLGQRLLEVAVLEGNRRLVGEGLQQAEVIVAERCPLRQAVGDDHRADDLRLAAQRADHVPVQRPSRSRVSCMNGPVDVGRRSWSGILQGVGWWGWTSGSRSCHDLARRPSASADRGYRTTSATSARNIVRAWLSSATSVEIDLRRQLQDPRGLVQELEPFVLLAFGDVRLVGDEDHHEREHEQPEHDRVQPQDRHREQRQARIRPARPCSRTGSSRAASGIAGRHREG